MKKGDNVLYLPTEQEKQQYANANGPWSAEVVAVWGVGETPSVDIAVNVEPALIKRSVCYGSLAGCYKLPANN